MQFVAGGEGAAVNGDPAFTDPRGEARARVLRQQLRQRLVQPQAGAIRCGHKTVRGGCG